ncbi:MAG: hypothetical protein Q9207_003995 [Kuettlingeria erythrocarpa]
MEANASPGPFLHLTDPPNHQLQQRLPSPLLDFVGQIREALASRGTINQALGKSIFSGKDEIVRLVAGTIIREMVNSGLSKSEFLPTSGYPDTQSIFLDQPDYTSQWTLDFVEYIDGLETQARLTTERAPSFFAYGVSVDGTVYNTECGLSILVTVTDELTIVIPSTDTDPVKYIDIPLDHIANIQVVEGGAGSQPRSNPEATPAMLAFDLLDTNAPAYYINESVRAPCGFNLAFDAINDAESLEAKIEANTIRQRSLGQQNLQHTVTLSNPEASGPTALVFSQSRPLNISQVDQTGPTRNQVSPTSHDLRSMNTTPMFETCDHINGPSCNSPNLRIKAHERGPAGKSHTDRAAATGVSVARYVVNVSQEIADRNIRSHENSNSGNNFDTERTDLLEWHDGMDVIEHAREFNIRLPVSDAPAQSEIFRAITDPQANAGKDTVLHTASKTHQMKNPPEQIAKEAGRKPRMPARQNTPSVTGSVTVSTRLSRIMRVEGDERSSAPLSTRKETIESTQDRDIAVAKQKASLGSRSSYLKRKVFDGVETAGSSKRHKAQEAGTQKHVVDVDKTPTVADVFEISVTPSPSRQEEAKLRTSAKNKSRAVKGKGKAAVQGKAAQRKVAKNSRPLQSQHPTQRKNKDRFNEATATAAKRPTRSSRAAAQKAMDQMRAADDESEVEEDDLASRMMDEEAVPKAKEEEQTLATNKPKRSSNDLDQASGAPESHAWPGRVTAAKKNEQLSIPKPIGMVKTRDRPSPRTEREQVLRRASPAVKHRQQATEVSPELSDQQHTVPGEPINYSSLQPPAASHHHQHTTSTATARPLVMISTPEQGEAEHVHAALRAEKFVRGISKPNPSPERFTSEHPSALDVYDEGAQTSEGLGPSDKATQPCEDHGGCSPDVDTPILRDHDSRLQQAQEASIQSALALERHRTSRVAVKSIPIMASENQASLNFDGPFVTVIPNEADGVSGSQLPNLLASEPSNFTTARIKERPPQASTPHPRIQVQGGYASTPPQDTTPKSPLPTFETSEIPPALGLIRQSMAPAQAADGNIVPSRISGQKKRFSNFLKQSSRKKMKRTPDATPAQERGSISTNGPKDPRRIPQVINFSAKGPRNQGLFSPAFGSEAGRQHKKPQRVHDPSSGQRRERDTRTVIANSTNSSKPSSSRLHPFGDIEDKDMPGVPDNPSQPEPSVHADRRSDRLAQGALLQHSSLFPEASGPKISSQGSRVNENGSPLPAQRTRNVVLPIQKARSLDADSDYDFTEIQDEATIVQHDDDETPKHVLPPIRASTAPTKGRKKQVGFVGSSNSKHRPSSPSAPSEMLTAFQPHTAESDGQFVNVHTEAVLIPSKPQDPFASQPAQTPNHFLDKLRRATYNTSAKGQVGVGETTSSVTRKDAATMTEQDPDETLVGSIHRRPRRRREETPTTTDTSSTTSSGGQTNPSEASSPVDRRWLDALEPHQEDMLAMLYEISHNLIGHLVDIETAVKDVVKDYQRRGERMVKTLADDLERKLQQHTAAAEARRDRELKRYEEFQQKVSKDLPRTPEAEDLTKQLEERQSMLDAQIQEAIEYCAQGIESDGDS